MPVISVITPFHGERVHYALEAGSSIAAQELPVGWSLEWVVQSDGPSDPCVKSEIDSFAFAQSYWHPFSVGPAAARNIALTHARGEYIHTLDSDDVLLPGALAVAVNAITTDNRIQWVVGQADDLLPNGDRQPHPSLLPTGFVSRGSISPYLDGDDELPVQTAGLTARTDVVRALGGWAAHPIAEDTLLFVALSEICDGWFTPEVTWLYRQHTGQITRTSGRGEPSWNSRIAERQRIAALRNLWCR